MLFALICVSCHGAQNVLCNGIELPEQWPPQTQDPSSYEPMDVPYLKQPPKVIPINVGRQLFVDDFLIESSDMSRVFHQAIKYEHNPVFTPQTDWELKRRGVVYLGHGGVFYDPQDKLFKMFYTAGWRGPLAMATSPDLVNWTRPEVKPGSNVLISKSVDDNSIWLDLYTSNPDQRLKYLEFDRKRDRHVLYTSPDGQKWSQGVVTDCKAGDYCSFFYNPFRQVWVYSIKQETRGRNRYYYEHADFLKGFNWSDAVYWINTDVLDEPEPKGHYPNAGESPQLYSLNAVAYESLMVGVHYIHRGPNNKICQDGKFPKLTDLELGFSRDGFHWHRPAERKPLIAGTRQEGDWDRAYLHSTIGVFLVCDDKLVFPYTGFSGIAPDGSRGMYHGASIGLAFLRRDGFASMEAGRSTCTLTTRPVTFDGQYLFVNVDCPEGDLRVEVIDDKDNVIAPFTKNNCQPMCVNSNKQLVRWETADDLSALKNKPVKFRFYLTGGKIYSFWVSPHKTGESRGYMAAGGPDYDDVMDK